MGVGASHEPLEDETQENSLCLTPSKRLLYVDPRSPSVGIDRTPILVQKTPPDVFDPRSPTPGIVRTPVPNALDKTHQPKTHDVLAEVHRNVQSTEEWTDEPSLDSMELQYSEELDTRGALGLDSLSLLELNSDERSHLLPASQLNSTDSESNMIVTQRSAKTGSLPKQLFAKKDKRLTNGNGGSETRSPLRSRNLDIDSPRIIIQRKQATNVDSKMSYRTVRGAENTPPLRDKENMQMK